MGGYQTVDKSAERSKIANFLKQNNSVSLSNIREKSLPSGRQNLRFDENGKLVK